MSTVKTWFVEAKYGKITTYLSGDHQFSLNLANARMFNTEAEAKAQFDGSPHFGETPERLRSLASDSWMKRRFPHYTFRAVCLEIEPEDRKHGLFQQHAMVHRTRLRDRLFSLPGLRRLGRFLRLERE